MQRLKWTNQVVEWAFIGNAQQRFEIGNNQIDAFAPIRMSATVLSLAITITHLKRMVQTKSEQQVERLTVKMVVLMLKVRFTLILWYC